MTPPGAGGKGRMNTQYQKRPTNQLLQVYGEFNLEEFNKIGNQFSHEVHGDRSIRREKDLNENMDRSQNLETQQNPMFHNNLHPNEGILNKSLWLNTQQSGLQADLDCYPTMRSVIDANESQMLRNSSNQPFPIKANNFNKSNNIVNNSYQPNQFDFGGGNYIGESRSSAVHTINNNFANHTKPKVDNVWDYTENGAQNFGGNHGENRIASYNNGFSNTVEEKPGDIDFSALLGTKSTGIQSQMHQLNKPAQKDPFEGFY